jgi:hypothetical protein
MAEKGGRALASVDRRPLGLFERFEREMEDMRPQLFVLFRRPLPETYRSLSLTETDRAPMADAYEMDGTLLVKAECRA